MVTKTKEVEKAVVPKMEKAVVTWQGRKITVTFDDVKNRICPRASDQEVIVFLKICQSLNLNPWARDVYMVKYKEDEPASIIVSTEAYLKGAETCSEFDGYEAGVILKDTTGKLEFREGALVMDEETSKLVGGWAKVYRKDRKKPFYIAVNIKECEKYTREGKPTRFWREMPATMIRKVALSRALREAFATRLGGVITEVECEEIAEGELPPAYERNGEPYWRMWWARQKEKGLSEDDVHGILGIDSLREHWLEKGRTLEEAEDIISKALPLVTRAKALGLSLIKIEDMLGMAIISWFAEGKTAEEAAVVISEKLAMPKADATAEKTDSGIVTPAEEDLAIDLDWLKGSQQTLRWTNDTLLSFITNIYKVNGKTVTEALNKLTRQQAGDFTRRINEKLESQSSLL